MAVEQNQLQSNWPRFTDTLLRTVCFAPGERKASVPLNSTRDTQLIRTRCMAPLVSVVTGGMEWRAELGGKP